MVSFTGSSIGHHLRGLRVQDARTGANIGVFRAVLRVAAKSFLGWFSVVFMLLTKRHQTIHDMVVKSVVVFKNPDEIADGQALEEREAEEAGYMYPSKGRRVLIIVGYCVVAFVLVVIPGVLLTSEQCLLYDTCNELDRFLETVSSIVWLVMCVVCLVFGWRGRLPGARRTPLSDDEYTA